ncbi:MAG: flagellin, partial [Acidobacteriaceae bacterium]|nr:flagellin [Acidobacteriaceae bacterium]
RDEVVSLANTSYAGTYLFSGTSGVQPYSNDTSTSPATATYAGDSSQQYTQAPGGQSIITGLPGSAIFSASGADVLGSLNRLIADFQSGTASSTATDDLNELRESLTNVSSQRSVLDASLNSLQLTTSYATTEATNLKASQSSLVSTDSAQVATQLSQNQTQQQALLSAITLEGKYNLFDYLS